MGRARPAWRSWPHVLVAAGLVGAAVALVSSSAHAQQAIGPGILAPVDAIVGEADGDVDFVVRLAEPSADTVTAGYDVTARTASAGTGTCPADFVEEFGTVTFDPGETSAVVSAQVTDCSGAEGFETFSITVHSALNGVIRRGVTIVGIVDNDTIVDTPTLVARDVVVDEKDGTASVSVLLGGVRGQASASTVTVSYQSAHGSATGGDYTATSGTLTFAPGETAKTVLVPITDDAADELDESFAFGLSGPAGSTILDGSATVTIGPSDATPVAVPIASAQPHVLVGEADGVVDLVVTLSAPPAEVFGIVHEAMELSAEDGTLCSETADIGALFGVLRFGPGETTRVVRVELVDCPALENFESFLYRLRDPGNTVLVSDQTRVGIVDNDTVVDTPELVVRDAIVDEKEGDALVSVLLGGTDGQASNGPVTVDYATSPGTATSAGDFASVSGTLVFAAGETAKTVPIPINDDASAEPVEGFTLDLSGADGATISDGSGDVTIGRSDATAVAATHVSAPPDAIVGEGDGFVDLVVSLSAPALDAVAVGVSVSETDGFEDSSCATDAGFASGRTAFAPGETTKVVRVDIWDCLHPEGFESIVLDLFEPESVDIGRELSRVGIVDNDTVVATPTISVRDAVVDERGVFARVAVLLGGARGQASAEPVTVDYASADGSAAAGSDHAAKSGMLTFAPGETAKTILVPIVDDTVAEPFEHFEVALSAPVGGTVTDGSARISIGASDATPVAVPSLFGPPDLIVGEPDGYVDLVLSLSAPGTAVVTSDFFTFVRSAFDGSPFECGDFEGVDNTFTFLPGETTTVVRVDISDYCSEPEVEILESFLFLLDADPDVVTIARGETQIGIVDNDTVLATPTLEVRDAVVDEKDGEARVMVLLGGPRGAASAGPVSVDYGTSNGTASAGSDFMATSGTLIFAPGETVKNVLVPITDDASDEVLETLTLGLSGASGATIADGSASVSIGANDGVAVATPALSIADTTVGENEGYVDVVVSLSEPGLSTITAVFLPFDVTAVFGFECDDDYEDHVGLLTFAPGETTKVVRIHLFDCDTVEHAETFEIDLFLPVSATIAKGTGVITILDDEVALPTAIVVTPTFPVLEVGQVRQLKATRSYSNAPSVDVTGSVTWNSSDSGIATIAAGGLAQAVRIGSTTISATLGPFTGTTTLHVAGFTHIVIAPLYPTIAPGGTQQLRANGYHTSGAILDLTSSVAWASSNAAVATIGAGGLAQAVGIGTATITASGYGVVGWTDLTVSAPPPPGPTPSPVRCKVPKVVGKPLAAAKRAITRGRCATGKVTRAYSGKVKKGRVVSQSRRAGRVMPLKSKVNLVVSRGPRPSR